MQEERDWLLGHVHFAIDLRLNKKEHMSGEEELILCIIYCTYMAVVKTMLVWRKKVCPYLSVTIDRTNGHWATIKVGCMSSMYVLYLLNLHTAFHGEFSSWDGYRGRWWEHKWRTIINNCTVWIYNGRENFDKIAWHSTWFRSNKW